MTARQDAWPKEMRDMFERLFPTHGYAEIMRAMNRAFPGRDLTRSAICGHAFRNGFRKGKRSAAPVRSKIANNQKHQHTVKRIAKAKAKEELATQREELGLDDADLKAGRDLLNQPCWEGTIDSTIGLLQMTDETCRWPLQVTGESMYRWCKNRKGGRGPYCLAHGSMSYTSARERQEKHTPHYRESGVGSRLWGR